MLKVLSVVGTRPQFIKAAAVSRAIRDTPGLTEVMVHSGQHFEGGMSDVFFRDLDMPPPTYALGIHGGGHGEMTGRMLVALEPLLVQESPHVVVVYGDTNTTLAGALAAAKLRLPLAHVEAGLRSFNRTMPEETNRVLTDHVSSLLLCPTRVAVENLAREGIVDGVHHTGDVMFDTALHAAEQSLRRSRVLSLLGLRDGDFRVATVHRAENTDDRSRLQEVLRYLKSEAAEQTIVMPLHPRTRSALEEFGLDLDGLVICPPVGYLDMARLLRGATRVYTDSGGLQKEAYFHRVPCVTLRGETEWTETIEAGWNRLWTVAEYASRSEITDYGNGDAAREIVHLIAQEASSQGI